MLDDWGVSITGIRKLLGGLVVFVISWQLFEIAIQPALVSISPIFADQALYGTGAVGRYPDNLAQVALFSTLLLGLFTYYMLKILVFEGLNEFSNAMIGLYGLLIVLLIAIFKNDILPIFGIDRWEHDPTEEDFQGDES